MSEKRKAADGGIKTLYSIISTVPSDRHCVTGLSDGRVLSSAPIRYDLMSQTEIIGFCATFRKKCYFFAQ